MESQHGTKKINISTNSTGKFPKMHMLRDPRLTLDNCLSYVSLPNNALKTVYPPTEDVNTIDLASKSIQNRSKYLSAKLETIRGENVLNP